jgi:serine/threonine protein phosphatase PrpC
LYKQVSETRIADCIALWGEEPEKMLNTLALEAESEPHSDNVTIVFVKVTA